MAAREGDSRLVQMLLSFNADPCLLNSHNQTAGEVGSIWAEEEVEMIHALTTAAASKRALLKAETRQAIETAKAEAKERQVEGEGMVAGEGRACGGEVSALSEGRRSERGEDESGREGGVQGAALRLAALRLEEELGRGESQLVSSLLASSEKPREAIVEGRGEGKAEIPCAALADLEAAMGRELSGRASAASALIAAMLPCGESEGVREGGGAEMPKPRKPLSSTDAEIW